MAKTRQIEHPKLVPQLTAAQMRGLEYAEALEAVDDAKERAEKRKEAMLEAATEEKLAQVKVRDAQGKTHTFDIDWKLALKHTAKFEVERVKAQDDIQPIGANGE